LQSTVDCIPCYIKQAISALRTAGIEQIKHQEIINALFPIIAKLDASKTPAENSSLVLFEAYRLMGRDDPFLQAKTASNHLARTFLPALERIISFSQNPLLAALQTSVAGNVIDMGINPNFDIGESISQGLERGFKRDDLESFREYLAKDGPLVIIGDNSGEIVFDRLLLEKLSRYSAELYYVVKGGAILNDATKEDAEDMGICLQAKVLTTGNNYLGVVPEICSQELRSVIKSANLVLAKGQANYETLEGTAFAGAKTFFLLQAKCPLVAAHLGVELGDSVFVRNKL